MQRCAYIYISSMCLDCCLPGKYFFLVLSKLKKTILKTDLLIFSSILTKSDHVVIQQLIF